MTKEQAKQIIRLQEIRDEILNKVFNIKLYPYQLEPSNKIIEYAVLANGEELPIEYPRQCGKTECIVDTVAILMVWFPIVVGKPIRIGIFAPQQEQAKTDFDRLKDFFQKLIDEGNKEELNFEESNGTTIDLNNGSMAYAFPVSKTSHPESKTLDLIIIEESQDIIDKKIDKAVIPMGASTSAPIIRVGTAGYSICQFYRLIEVSNLLKFKIDCEEVIRQKQEAYEKDGNVWHLNYKKHIDKQIERLGRDNDEIKTQYFNEWVIGIGQFITRDKLVELRDDSIFLVKRLNDSYNKFFGLDTAKAKDQTVLIIIRELEARLEIIALLTLKGDNYQDQFDAIKGFLGKFNNVRAGAIDSTGQGDFMPDLFERHTQWRDGQGLFRVKFGLQTKDILYKNYGQVLQKKVLRYPNPDKAEGEDKKMLTDFELEHFDLQKEYKGIYLSVHHPDVQGAHDDYPDSAALAIQAYISYSQSSGIFEYTKEQAKQIPEGSEAIQEIQRLLNINKFEKL